LKTYLKIIMFFSVISVVALSVTTAYATNEESIKIIIAGSRDDAGYLAEKAIHYAPPVLVAGRVLVPLRAVAEVLGFAVSWDRQSRSIGLSKNETKLVLMIGKKKAVVNSQVINLDVAPRIINGRTLVPLRFVSRALNWSVHFEKDFQGYPTVWVTPYSLITAKDYGNLTAAYRKSPGFTLDYGWQVDAYTLRPGKETARGIKLGDSIGKVRHAYGVPFRDELDENQTGRLMYPFLPLPYSEPSGAMLFRFQEGKMVEAILF